MPIRAFFRLRVMRDALPAIGPGKIALLEAIVDTGSISAGARALGMSYNRAWQLIDAMNQALREPVVETSSGGAHGGGSSVTAAGRHLIAEYRAAEREAEAAAADRLRGLVEMVKPETPAGSGPSTQKR